MCHFARALIAGIIATVLVSGAEAAKMSAAERVALKKTTAAYKAEAEGMKFRWPWRKRQKYVQNCIIRYASKQGLDIEEVSKALDMKSLRLQRPGEWGCDPMC
jgi:transcription initiation factor TFIIIB Brf1 subunit/transcription initiation factor TFIIB